MHLVTIVGSNPMSSYAAIATLHSSKAGPLTDLTLVHTDQTLMSASLLAEVVEDELDLPGSVAVLKVVAGWTTDTRQTLEDLPGPWHLDFTGGTKAMSCGARLAFEFNGPRHDGDPHEGPDLGAVFYVDDHNGVLRTDLGEELPIDESSYSLRTIARLHGCQLDYTGAYEPQNTGAEGGWSLENRLNRIATIWNQGRSGTPAVEGGGVRWSVTQNLKMILNANRKCELDITVQRGRRVGLISCYSGTGDNAVGVAKNKLFEAIERARQLGGDLARVAIATNLKPFQVKKLSADLGPRWGPRQVAVWGAADVDALHSGDFTLWDAWWGPTR